MFDEWGDILRPPHCTTQAAVKANKNQTRGPLVLYRSPECWGDAELKQNWKYMNTQCFISCHPYRSIRKQIWPCHKNGQGQPRVVISKKAPVHGHTATWYKFWQHFKAFVIPIILYHFQRDPFCLIILYDILFYFKHVYIAPGQEETALGDNVFDRSRRILPLWSLVACFKIKHCPLIFMHTFSWFYICI